MEEGVLQNVLGESLCTYYNNNMYTGGRIYMRTRYVYAARSRKQHYPSGNSGGGMGEDCVWTRGWLGVAEALDCGRLGGGGVAKTSLHG